MNKFKRVEFKTIDGVTLRGNFFQAEGKNVPIAVMTDGLTFLKDHFVETFADAFQAAGISALVYDHRTFGDSDGMPRQEVNPLQQGEDFHDAISFAQTLPGVDAKKVIIWGIGHGATAAIIAAASDPRAAATIVQAPFYGPRDTFYYPEGALERAWKDRAEKTKTGSTEPVYVQVWPNNEVEAKDMAPSFWMRGEMAYGLYASSKARSDVRDVKWENKMTLQSYYYINRTDEALYLPSIKKPLLYVAATDDPFSGSVDFHYAQFQGVGSNGTFAVLPANPTAKDFGEFLAPAAKVMLDWLKKTV